MGSSDGIPKHLITFCNIVSNDSRGKKIIVLLCQPVIQTEIENSSSFCDDPDFPLLDLDWTDFLTFFFFCDDHEEEDENELNYDKAEEPPERDNSIPFIMLFLCMCENVLNRAFSSGALWWWVRGIAAIPREQVSFLQGKVYT